jgi:hypothetical protein
MCFEACLRWNPGVHRRRAYEMYPLTHSYAYADFQGQSDTSFSQIVVTLHDVPVNQCASITSFCSWQMWLNVPEGLIHISVRGPI